MKISIGLLLCLGLIVAVVSEEQHPRGVLRMVRRKKQLPIFSKVKQKETSSASHNSHTVSMHPTEPSNEPQKIRRKMKWRRRKPVLANAPDLPDQNRRILETPVSEVQTRPLRLKKKKKLPSLRITQRPLPLATAAMPSDSGALNRTKEDSRFLSLFTIVTFKNELCVSSSGSNGTCYSTSDCSRLGGATSGSCASGFGVCCLFTKSCGDSTSNNGTYFQNTGFPSTFNMVGSCQLTVNKATSDVSQLRLDFDNFIVAQPEATDHICQSDQFVVSGGPPIPSICGTNSGLHLYVDMGTASNAPITLTVVTSGASFARSFSIKVTQIEASSMMKASDGCLQFFTGVSGQFTSFNYNSAAGLQLSNTDYTICVRTERNFCGIQYSACPDTTNTIAMSFSVTGGNPMLGSLVSNNCITDWITIPCATNTNSPTAQTGNPAICVDRICGMVFNSVTTAAGTTSVPVNSYVTPFNLFVHTDATEGSNPTPEASNRGFCLNYVQQPCNSPTG